MDRRSFSGYAFKMSGAAVTWRSQKQRTVAMSSTEAEYISLSEAVKEALHLRSLLIEIKLDELTDITIYVDNQGALCLAEDAVFHTRTKHINIRYHCLRDIIKKGHIKLQHLPTSQMSADIYQE